MNNPLMMSFNLFMQQMRGQDPTAILNRLVQSGRITQQQINQAHEQAKKMEPQFQDIRKNFGL